MSCRPAMHHLLPCGALFLSFGPKLQFLRNELAIADFNAAQHERKDMTVEHSGTDLVAKDPFIGVVQSPALPAVFYDFCKDGLKVCVGLGYNVWMKGSAVIFVVANG